MNTLLIIDGENFKGKLKNVFEDTGKDKPIWHEYDFKGLFDRVLKGFNIDKVSFYFARVKEHEKSKVKSKQLIEEQRQLKTHLEKQGFQIVLSGRVRGQMEKSQTGKNVLIFREKGVDVKIAVDMVSFSCDNKVKEIILCSSDSDLQPAIKEARDRNVSCVYLGFEIQPNKGISYTANKTILIRNSEVLEFEKIKEKKQKRVVIVHRWSGGPDDDWRPWLKDELEKRGHEVLIPEMPDTEVPVIEKWVNHLSSVVGKPDSDTYFIGHSIGCQTILRYLETVDTPVGGAVFVAGWFDLKNLEDKETEDIARPWVETPINIKKVKSVLPKSSLIISDNDPYGAFEENKQRFGEIVTRVMVLPNADHITDLKYPEILSETIMMLD
jgi:predicted alpha/beta hydrolase family esterase/uncharacterized LabA/DUF88 family protein